MALGLKLAWPERTIVQIVGDGTFYFSNPQSTLAVSRHYKLPVLTVVLDNTGWAAVKEATLRVYPDGEAKAGSEFGATLAPDMDFSKVAEAAGAHGELAIRRRRGRHRALPRRRAASHHASPAGPDVTIEALDSSNAEDARRPRTARARHGERT